MGSKRIKGLTIEIDGNATKLQSALKGVDSQLSKTQASLRDVNRLLKLDPHNTELLNQKHKLLGDQIEATKEKLGTLRDAEKEAQQQFKEGKISEEQYNSLKREIIETEEKLKNLVQTQSQMKFDEIGGKLQDVGGKVEDVGKKMLPVTAGIGAVGAAGVASLMKMDEAYDTVITKTGATGEALESLNDSVDNVFSEMPSSVEDVGIAIGEVNTRFGLMGEELEEVSTTFLQFAEINDTDLNSAIDNTDKIMKKFNISAEHSDEVLGLLTKAGQDTGLSMDTLFTQLEQNGATMKEMGLSIEESTGLLAQFEVSGIDTSTALTGLRKAQQNAIEQGKTLDEALGENIDAIKNAGTETEALQIAVELFGKKGATEMTQAIREGKFSLDDLGGSMTEYGTTVQDTFEATQDPWDQAKVATNNLMIAGKDLGETIMGTLAPVIEKITAKVQKFTKWFGNLDEKQKKTVVTIGAVVAAVGPMLVIVGKAITLAGTLTKGVGKVNGMLKAAKAAGGVAKAGLGLFSGPILPIVALIGGLVAAGVLLYKNWDKIKEKAGALKKSISEKWNGIKSKTSEVWGGIKDTITEKITAAKDKVKSIIDKIKGLFSFKWSLPKLELPHIQYDVIKVPVLGEIPNPTTLKVKWYKKAMESAYMLSKPTFFGTNGNTLLGGGEAGNEMIIGENKLMKTIAQATNADALVGATERTADRIIAKLDAYLPGISQQQVILDSGKIVGELTPKINNNLGNLSSMGRRGYI